MSSTYSLKSLFLLLKKRRKGKKAVKWKKPIWSLHLNSLSSCLLISGHCSSFAKTESQLCTQVQVLKWTSLRSIAAENPERSYLTVSPQLPMKGRCFVLFQRPLEAYFNIPIYYNHSSGEKQQVRICSHLEVLHVGGGGGGDWHSVLLPTHYI